MSVLISGIELPKENHARVLVLHDDGRCIDEFGNVFEAVSVPPHGRLGDLDALLMRITHEIMEAYMDGVCYGVHPSQEYLYLLGEIIDDAPTVIPARLMVDV